MADLAIFAHTISVGAAELGVALKSEAKRRSLVLPDTLAAPIEATGRAATRGSLVTRRS